ncbi:MAG: hypothetical protein UX35_C0016G0003 [Microgenomates group bacterium GW2011_GWA1_46_15]|nr:MAG: hypothetical protein UX00_C0015G0003 [Microgenomates group bacterium GW2011_GWB1_45_17]KKU22759.1 MAG: hypothetical protein UX35_C0016G0003 [Microgenomates group bacterium GW2011_GWA1_46_15]KKU24020.1 MAG: hypothetical protein UX36_C0002G0003 [Microgenomates group bacterium GW2011_GWC1_46_15]
MKLGKGATRAQFLRELKKENIFRAYNGKVRAGFNAHRRKNGWPEV